MLRVALRPRFLGLLALMVAATVVCGLLATWQWDRAHRAREAAPARSEAVDLTTLMGVGEPVSNQLAGRAVTVSGTFAPDEQVLVPGRGIDGEDAVIVVTALHVPQADGSTARLPVARGWIPASGVPDPSDVPVPPSGPVEVTGMLEASEAAQSGIAGDGTVQEIATPLLVNVWGAPMYAGYVAETSPSPGLRPMPAAVSEFSRGLNIQNLGYAAQWILFGGFFLYLWWRSVRTRYLDEQAEAHERLVSRLAAAGEQTGTVGDPAATPPAPTTTPARTPVPAPMQQAPLGAEEDTRADDTTAR